MKKMIYIIALICAVCGYALASIIGERMIADELGRLNIEVVGPGNQTEEQLPDMFFGPFEGLMNIVCREGGYDLQRYAGQKVLSTFFPISEVYQGEALNVWILSTEDRVICVYKTVRGGSDLVPGMFAITQGK